MALECGAIALECGAMSGNVSRIVSAKLPRPFEGRVLQHYLNCTCTVLFLLCVFLSFEFYGTAPGTREISFNSQCYGSGRSQK